MLAASSLNWQTLGRAVLAMAATAQRVTDGGRFQADEIKLIVRLAVSGALGHRTFAVGIRRDSSAEFEAPSFRRGAGHPQNQAIAPKSDFRLDAHIPVSRLAGKSVSPTVQPAAPTASMAKVASHSFNIVLALHMRPGLAGVAPGRCNRSLRVE